MQQHLMRSFDNRSIYVNLLITYSSDRSRITREVASLKSTSVTTKTAVAKLSGPREEREREREG